MYKQAESHGLPRGDFFLALSLPHKKFKLFHHKVAIPPAHLWNNFLLSLSQLKGLLHDLIPFADWNLHLMPSHQLHVVPQQSNFRNTEKEHYPLPK